MASASKAEWSRAFAKQAISDFDTWVALHLYLTLPTGAKPLPVCQRLNFLQMACEKLCKAHLLKAGSELSDLEQSHAYVAKILPPIVRQQMIFNGENERVANAVREQCKHIAREIELLSPAVKGGGKRADNCEYPWEQVGTVRIPAEWPFTNLDVLLTKPQGRNILKRIREAILRLTA
jgi:hypothetical protein